MKYILLIWNTFDKKNTLFLIPENDIFASIITPLLGRYINSLDNDDFTQNSLINVEKALFCLGDGAPNVRYHVHNPTEFAEGTAITLIGEIGALP